MCRIVAGVLGHVPYPHPLVPAVDLCKAIARKNIWGGGGGGDGDGEGRDCDGVVHLI